MSRFKTILRQSLQIGKSLLYIKLKTMWKKNTSSKRVGYFRDGHQREGGTKGKVQFLTNAINFPNMTAMEIDGTRHQKYKSY